MWFWRLFCTCLLSSSQSCVAWRQAAVQDLFLVPQLFPTDKGWWACSTAHLQSLWRKTEGKWYEPNKTNFRLHYLRSVFTHYCSSKCHSNQTVKDWGSILALAIALFQLPPLYLTVCAWKVIISHAWLTSFPVCSKSVLWVPETYL